MFFLIARQARSHDAAARKRAAEKLGAGGRSGNREGGLPRRVTLLLDLVKDADFGVRAAAYDALGRVADARALDMMAAGLKDIDKAGEAAATAVRDAAARAFQAMGPEAAAALVGLARDKNTRTREAAVAALGGIGGADAERSLVAALQDPRSSVRQIAVQSLARSAAPGSIGALAPALEHRDPATRRSAIEALADIKAAEAAGALSRLTRDGDRGVREAAVRGLIRHGSSEAIEGLFAVFEGQDRDLRQLAAAGLKGLDWQPSTPGQRALRAILLGDYEAAAAEGEPAVDPLAALLGDKSPAVRTAVSEALGRTARPSAIRPLLAALQDHDAGVCQAASDALVQVGAASAAPLACAVHEAARAAATDVVLRIGAPAAAPLLDLLEQGEPFVNDATEVRRVADDEEAERAERAAHLLVRLLGQAGRAFDAQVLGRAARARDVVRVREILPASRRDSVTTVVETVVDCEELRHRAAAELERRRA
jgi:HEAT repeat protein